MKFSQSYSGCECSLYPVKTRGVSNWSLQNFAAEKKEDQKEREKFWSAAK